LVAIARSVERCTIKIRVLLPTQQTMAPAGKSNPSSIHDGALPKKQTNPKRNALWLTRKKAREKIVEDTVNAKRAALGLSAVTLRLPHECSFKGGTRPSYNPPPEEMEKMTEDDLKAWREVERKKR